MKNVKPLLFDAFQRVIPVAFLTLFLCLPIGLLFRMAAFQGCNDTLEGIAEQRTISPEIPLLGNWGDPELACPRIGKDTSFLMTFGSAFPLIWLVLFVGSYIKYPYEKE